MAGTKIGGLRAAQTNKEKYGSDFYKRIGRVGGAKGHTGGFYYSAANGYDWHIKAGAKGGKVSKRPKSRVVDVPKPKKHWWSR